MIEAIEAVLRSEIGGYEPMRDAHTFESLGLDSFDLVNLRSALEAKTGHNIPDADWVECRRPADLKRYFANGSATKEAPGSMTSVRRFKIGMPQMAVGGLSENWLFKEIGDFHWSLIASGLGVESSQMFDGSGNRLYATFTRFRVETDTPWSAYGENEDLAITGSIARYGSGQFMGVFKGTSGTKSFSSTVLSSFSARSSEGSNSDLRKGQPVIPPDCPIPALAEKPPFVQEYQQRRAQRGNAKEAVFNRIYEINPYVDINGVGLLYFAAYPTIADFCEMGHFGRSWPDIASTQIRDVFYFANSDASEVLRYRIQSLETAGRLLTTQATLARADGTPMALIETQKSVASQWTQEPTGLANRLLCPVGYDPE